MSAAVTEADFHTKDATGVPMPKTGTYLRHAQVAELNSEISGMEQMLGNPLLAARLEDPAGMQKRVSDVRQMLAVQAPPKLSADQRDAASKQEIELRNTIRDSMCSSEEMRKSPSGAVGKYRKGEASTAMKHRIIAWKNLKLMLNPGDDDPDLCSIEQLRRDVPSTLTMVDAFIPGKKYFIPTEASKAGYDRVFGSEHGEDPGEDPQIVELRAELAEIKAAIASAIQAPSEEAAVRKSTARKPKKRSTSRVYEKIEMKCGKRIDSRGVTQHRKFCSKRGGACEMPEVD